MNTVDLFSPRVPIFNYQWLKVSLLPNTKAMEIQLSRIEKNNALNFEILFELETALKWCLAHVEVQSLIITSLSPYFAEGPTQEESQGMDFEKMKKLTQKVQGLINLMLQLPQTVIFDLRESASNLGLDLSLGADFRICHENAQLKFDHLKKGFGSSSGTIGILPLMVAPSYARSWSLSGENIPKDQFVSSGFIFSSYNESNHTSILHQLLVTIHSQSQVQRIQAKLGHFERLKASLNEGVAIEQRTGHASLLTEDWRAKASNQATVSPMTVSSALREKLPEIDQ